MGKCCYIGYVGFFIQKEFVNLIEYASWLYRKGRINCAECIELKAENNNKPDCVACKHVQILPENYEVVGIIERYSSYFGNGMGGINSSAIQHVLELEEIPMNQRKLYTRKFVVFMNSALQAQRGN